MLSLLTWRDWKNVGGTSLEIAVLSGFLTLKSAQGTSGQRRVVF